MPDELGHIIDFIQKHYTRPEDTNEGSNARRTNRSASVEPPSYPFRWATDNRPFRDAIKRLGILTKQFRSEPAVARYIANYQTPTPSISSSIQAPSSTHEQSSTQAQSSTPPTTEPQSGRNRANSSTSTEEVIRDNMGDQVDERTQRLIDAAITNYLARHPPQAGQPGPPGPAGPEGPPGIDAAAASSGKRFSAADIGFFDPFYDGKSVDTAPAMEHSGKDTFFRDVHVFIDRIKDVARTQPELLRRNLQLCLRGSALEWYTSELTDGEKRLAQYGDNVDEWTTLLLARFKPPRSTGMAVVLREKYSLQDAARHREPREYAQTVIRAAKTAELGGTPDHLLLIWNGLDLEFQRDIDEPTQATTQNSFLQELDKRKHQWWAYAARSRLPQQAQQTSRVRQPDVPSRSFNYNNNRQYQPYQPNFQRQPFYQQPYSSYGGGNGRSYNNYGNNAYQYQNQYNRGQPSNANAQQARLPTPPQRLQITAGPSNSSGSANQPNNNNRNADRGGNYRQPLGNAPFNQNRGNYGQQYRGPRYGAPFQPREQRAYQATVTDENDDGLADKDSNMDSTTPYEEPWDPEPSSEYASPDYESYDDVNPGEQRYDGTDIHFINPTAVSTVSHPCERCYTVFPSRNKLFEHLRAACWKKPSTELASSSVRANPGVAVWGAVPEDAKMEVIKSTATPVSGTGDAFKSWHYAVTQVYWTPDCLSGHNICVDSGCGMSIIDRKFLSTLSGYEIKHMGSKVRIRGIGSQIHLSDEFIVLTFYLRGKLNGQQAAAAITRELHVVDELKANMLIGNDIITPEGMCLDFSKQQLLIGSCQNIRVPFSTVARQDPHVKRTIRARAGTVLAPNSVTRVPVTYHGQIPDDRDFLFEPQLANVNLGDAGGVFAHVVDSNFSFVQVHNTSTLPVTLPRRVRLGSVVEYNQDGCYHVDVHPVSASTGWRSWKSKGLKVAKAAIMAALLTKASLPPAVPKDPSEVPSVSSSSVSSSVDPNLERVLPSGITVYGAPDTADALTQVLEQYEDVFTDSGTTVDIPESDWMPINLKPGADPKPARVYPLSQKDRDVVDDTFNKMHEQGKMSFVTQPTRFSYPVFVVWRTLSDGTRKGRVVVDIRGLNQITESDSYPLPLQSDIIASLAGYRYITVVDAVGWFHQFRVKPSDRDKFTVVSHRGQEQSSVALMGYKGSPPYVQRQTDQLLRPYRSFARAYMDDMIVFSRTLDKHIEHLHQLLSLFRERRISLAPNKSFVGYPSVRLLGQKVDAFGMSTAEDKIAAIAALKFPISLRDLEIFLGMTGWLRTSIPRYAQRAEPLQKRKTLLTKSVSARGTGRKLQATRTLLHNPLPTELEAFASLKRAFSEPRFLVHFDPQRQLYADLDASKSFGFAAMVYHIKGDPVTGVKFTRVDIQPIMFISKCLNAAERNYWPTELEVAGVVWLVKKIRYMVDSTCKPPTIIYTDHSAAIPISKQTTLNSTSTDKLNLRLVRASQYLSAFNIELRHKAGKSNTVPDALSRLAQEASASSSTDCSSEGILDILYGTIDVPSEYYESWYPVIPSIVPEIYHVTLVEMSDDFKQRLRQAYQQDDSFKRIMDVLKEASERASRSTTPNVTPVAEPNGGNQETGEVNSRPDDPPEQPVAGINFALRDGLLYHLSGDAGKDRLCIPATMEQEVFKQAHDLSNHGGFHRTYDRIVNSCFIRHLAGKLRAYVRHCPTCQINQTKRHAPYGSLVPITSPAIPFHTITMDFVLALPDCNGMNVLLTITDKFTKRVLLLPGKDTYGAEDWAPIVISALLSHDWGVPCAIISDRDRKFMSSFWRTVFQKLDTKLLASTAYHPQTDGQSERTNQTIEISLRFWLTEHPEDMHRWVEILPLLQALNNNSRSSATGFAPNELSYGFKVRDTTSMLSDLPAEDWDRLRLIMREEAENALGFAAVTAKIRYDKKHKPVDLKVGDYAYLRLHHGYTLPGVENRKLSQQRAGPFKIIRRIGHLAYQLELPPVMNIHPVISIAQLEPAPAPEADPYQRPRQQEPPPVTTESPDDEAPHYEIERLLGRRFVGRNRLRKYLVKWKGYGPEHNTWYRLEDLADSMDLVREYDEQHP